MQELIITKGEDLAKLIGWTIEGIEVKTGPDACIILQMKHPSRLEWPIKVSIASGANVGRSGSVLICNTTLTVKVEDVK